MTHKDIHAGVQSGGGEVGIVEVLCFLAGTRILTAHGEMPVEDLAARRPGGDTLGRHAARVLDRPPRILPDGSCATTRPSGPCASRQGAGRGLPLRDLSVSPGHSMLLEGQLVLAQLLVNGVTVTQDDPPEEVHYYHLELATHDCVLAEGAWSETYADAGDLRGEFHNAAAFGRAPRLCAAGQARALRPPPGIRPALEALLQPVVARAAQGIRYGGAAWLCRHGHAAGTVEGWAVDLPTRTYPCCWKSCSTARCSAPCSHADPAPMSLKLVSAVAAMAFPSSRRP